jgi:dienelactone hydrolase
MPHSLIGRLCATLGTLMVAISPAASRDATNYVPIPPQSVPGSRMPSTALAAILTLPKGQAPYPAVILLHGCDGGIFYLKDWAARLAEWGYASIIPDSYTARSVNRVCAGPAEQRVVTPQDRAGDVISAALWLRTRPEIDGNRIGVVGFSNGGWTAMWVTQRRYQQLYSGLIKVAVSYYGNCAHPEDHGTVPLLVLVGEADDWADPAEHCRAFGAQLTPEQPFLLHTYPGVVHAFDDPRLQSVRYSEGHPLQYNAAAATDSFVRTKAFLDRYIGSPPG